MAIQTRSGTDPTADRNRRALARATADPAGALAALLTPAGRGALGGAARAFMATGRTPAAERLGALLWRVQMREQMIDLHTRPDGGGMPAAPAAAFRMEVIREAHAVRAGKGLTALALAVESGGMRPTSADPFRPVVRASLPGFERVAPADARGLAPVPDTLPGFRDGDGAGAADRQAALPGFEAVAAGGCPSWLLWAYDRAGGAATAQGRGAPWPLRLFVAALLVAAR